MLDASHYHINRIALFTVGTMTIIPIVVIILSSVNGALPKDREEVLAIIDWDPNVYPFILDSTGTLPLEAHHISTVGL